MRILKDMPEDISLASHVRKMATGFLFTELFDKVAEPIAEGKLIIRARKIAVDLLRPSIMLDEVLPVLVNGVMSSVDPNKSRTFR